MKMFVWGGKGHRPRTGPTTKTFPHRHVRACPALPCPALPYPVAVAHRPNEVVQEEIAQRRRLDAQGKALHGDVRFRRNHVVPYRTLAAQTSMVNELGREPYFADVPCEALLQRHYPAHFAVSKTRPDFSVYFRRKSRESAAPAG